MCLFLVSYSPRLLGVCFGSVVADTFLSGFRWHVSLSALIGRPLRGKRPVSRSFAFLARFRRPIWRRRVVFTPLSPSFAGIGSLYAAGLSFRVRPWRRRRNATRGERTLLGSRDIEKGEGSVSSATDVAGVADVGRRFWRKAGSRKCVA